MPTLEQLRAQVDAIEDRIFSEGLYRLRQEERKVLRQAEAACVAAGICFSCYVGYHEGKRGRVKLSPPEPGNYYEYAGRECPECGEFYPCGEQPEYAGPDYGPSDADQGL